MRLFTGLPAVFRRGVGAYRISPLTFPSSYQPPPMSTSVPMSTLVVDDYSFLSIYKYTGMDKACLRDDQGRRRSAFRLPISWLVTLSAGIATAYFCDLF